MQTFHSDKTSALALDLSFSAHQGIESICPTSCHAALHHLDSAECAYRKAECNLKLQDLKNVFQGHVTDKPVLPIVA